MDIKDVEDLAELAKLELTQEEKEKILSDMGGILAYVKIIEDVDLPMQTGVEETDVEYEHRNIWREDEPVESDDSSYDLITKQFPDSQDNFVKVKKIL